MSTAVALRDPVAEAFARAPAGEPFPPHVLDEIRAAEAEIAAGHGVRHDDVPAWLEAHAGPERAG